MAGLAVTIGVMAVGSVQAQVGVTVFALGIVNNLPSGHQISTHREGHGEILQLRFCLDRFFVIRIQNRVYTPFDAEGKRTGCIRR
jgi:hypothetical protein